MISRGRKYRIAIGLIAGWAMAVLVPGVVAGLMVYQVNVRRIDSVVPTLVSGVRAEVTVVEYLDRVCPGMDEETAKTFQRSLTKQGFKFQLGQFSVFPTPVKVN